jgi:hypothetical protein
MISQATESESRSTVQEEVGASFMAQAADRRMSASERTWKSQTNGR